MSGEMRANARYLGGTLALIALASCGRYANYGLASDAGGDAAALDAGDASDAGDVASEAASDAEDVPPLIDALDASDAQDASDTLDAMDVAADALDASDAQDASDASEASDALDAMDVAADALDVVEAGPEPTPEAGPEPTLEAGADASPEAGPIAGDPLVELVSVNAAGTLTANGSSTLGLHSVSDDGALVVFTSNASDLVAPAITFPAGSVNLIYLRDLRARTTTLVSARPPGASTRVPNGAASTAVISGDGSTVVFVSTASNQTSMASVPPTSFPRVYRWVRSTGVVDLVTVERDGSTPIALNEFSSPILTRDGQYLFFATRTFLHVPPPRPSGEYYTYGVDLTMPAATRTFTLVSQGTTGALPASGESFCTTGDAPGGGANTGPADVSSDGRYVICSTNATGLVPGDGDGCADAYVFERGTTNTVRVNGRRGGALASSRAYTIDETGTRTIVFTRAPLTLTDTNSVTDLFYGPIDGSSWRMISEPLAGRTNNGDSDFARIDGAATRVLFSSASSELVPGDTNNAPDLFLRDLRTNAITRVTTNADGSQIDHGCTPTLCTVGARGELSRDGTMAFFDSPAPLAGASDQNEASDVYLRRLGAPSPPPPDLELVSIAASGTRAGDGSSYVGLSHSISSDGRFVVFTSNARNLTNPAIEFPATPYNLIYLRDLLTHTTTLISRTRSGELPDGPADSPSISRDGAVIAFATRAGNMGDGPLPPDDRVTRFYVWRRSTGRVELAVGEPSGAPMNCVYGSTTVLSADGRYLSFATSTFASRPAPHGEGEVSSYLADLTLPLRARTYSLLSRTQAGTTPTGAVGSCGSEAPAAGANTWVNDLSGDGRFAVVGSPATGFVPGDVDGCYDAYRFERDTNNTVRINPRPAGMVGNLEARSIDDTGTYTLVETAVSISSGDMNGVRDVYYGAIGGSAWQLISVGMGGAASNGPSGAVAVDVARRRVLFYSSASNLVPNDTNAAPDLFVRDLTTNSTTRVSVALDGSQLAPSCAPTCPSGVYGDIAADGRTVVFDTRASAVGAIDANTVSDVYVRRLR